MTEQRRQELITEIGELSRKAHTYAVSLPVGDSRTEAFSIYEVLRRIQRRGAAAEMLEATNPLIRSGLMDYDNMTDDDGDEE